MASGQDAGPTPPPPPKPQSTPKVQRPPQLELFDSSLYSAEPFLDSALQLTKEQFDAILAANSAHKSNPAVKAAKAAEAAASGGNKEDAYQAKKAAERANDDARKAARDANLTEDLKTLIETLNQRAKVEKQNANSEAGLKGLSKLDPHYEETKKKCEELEREYLLAAISQSLSGQQQAAVEKARSQQRPAP